MDSNSIVLWLSLIGAFILIGVLVRRRSALKRRSHTARANSREDMLLPDTPISFGYKCAWYSVPSPDSRRVSDIIGLRKHRPANWQDGIAAAYKDEVFVSPPVNGWTFAVGVSLAALQTEELPVEIGRKLAQLSTEFRAACFFATHRIVELHVWAKAVDGVIERACGYLGETGELFWDEGSATEKEVVLLGNIGEEAVMQMAREWSIAPTDLDGSSADASIGIVGVK